MSSDSIAPMQSGCCLHGQCLLCGETQVVHVQEAASCSHSAWATSVRASRVAAAHTLRGRSPSQHAKLLLPTQCMGSCRQGLPMLLQDEGWPWNSPERGMRVLAPSSSSSAHAELAVLALAAS